MSTKCTITAKRGEEDYATVSCHWDGYPTGVGKLLLEHYNTEARVRALLSLGNLSSLHQHCHLVEGHTFSTPVEGYSVFYGRDRGDRRQDAIETTIRPLSVVQGIYVYFWDGDKWFVNNVDLAEHLAQHPAD